MTELFLDIVNMSIAAGWLVLAVLVLRFILKKAPKWVNVLLWGIVAVRLICPFSIESALSLIPSTETISPEIMMDRTPEITTGIPALNRVINPVVSESFAPNLGDSANPLQILIPIASVLWGIGIVFMLGYTIISYLILRRKLRTAVILRDNLFQCETVSSPFVLGILKPKIYLPYTMEDQNLKHVIAHEQAHIRRKDHWWKPLGFLLLTIHWFNPLMWVAYILLCRDIELACDEKVIAELGSEQRADYTQALVACSINRRMIAACPLAFGEVGVKERVKSILNYRKPTFWIIVTALVVCVVVAVCFLTDPNPSREFSMSGNNVTDLNPEAIVERILDIEDWEASNVYVNANNFPLQVDSNFNWADSQAILYFFSDAKKTYSGQLRILPKEDKYFLTESNEWSEQNQKFLLRLYLDAIKYLPQNAIREMAPADQYIILQREEGRPSDYDRVIAYSSEGVQPIDGWYIHLQIQPLHADGGAFNGNGEEVIELFYGSSNGKYSDHAEMWFDFTAAMEKMDYTYEMKCSKKEFPGITFKYTPYEIVASTSWEDDDAAERTVLISGMPIWNAYFSDLTGDGFPEICSEVSMGSGIIDEHVIIYDYANGVSYKLEDRGYHDYYLRMNDADGYLYVDKRVYNSDEVVSSGKLVFKDGCIQIEGVDTAPSNILQAKVLEIHDAYFLVEPVEGSWELSSASKIEVPMRNMEPSPEPQVGDILEIEYDGQLQETYPARITEVYGIRVISERPYVTEALTLNEVAELVKQQHTVSFVGMTREAVHGYWGEPDSEVYGFFGDIYHVPNSTESLIFCYDEHEIVESLIVEYRNDSEDWGLSLRLQFESESEFDIVISHSSANQTIDGTISVSPEYEIQVVHNGKIISYGTYMRDVLGYDYADTIVGWDTVLYNVESNGELIIDCNVSTIYGSLPAGEYMLYKPVQLTTKAGETIIKEYVIKFTIVPSGTELHIPEKEEILQNGYPINALGETYGPDIRELGDMPDLVLVRNETDVFGYVRASELEGNHPTTPNDAEYYELVRTVNMYLQDGITVIGKFRIS